MIIVGLVVVIKGHFNNVKYLQEHNNSLKNSITLVEGTNDALEKKSEEQRVKIEEVEKELVVKDGEIDSLKKLQDKIKQDKIRRDHNNLVVSSRGGSTSSVGGNWITMQASAYTNAPSENGGYTTTAMGDPLVFGMVAVDPNFLPLGTRINIEGYGNTVFKCSDTGGAIKGSRIDILLNSKSEAMQFGRRSIRVKIIK